MGEMPSFEGAAKWKAPKTPKQEKVIEVSDEDIVQDMNLLSGKEKTVPGLQSQGEAVKEATAAMHKKGRKDKSAVDLNLLGDAGETVPGLEPEGGAAARESFVAPESLRKAKEDIDWLAGEEPVPGLQSPGEAMEEASTAMYEKEQMNESVVDLKKSAQENTRNFIENALSNKEVAANLMQTLNMKDVGVLKNALEFAMTDEVKRVMKKADPEDRRAFFNDVRKIYSAKLSEIAQQRSKLRR